MGSADTLTPVLDGLTFPEAPRWHDGRLWLSDFYSERVLAIGDDGEAECVVRVPGRPSGLGWDSDGSLLVVSMLERSLMRLADGRLDRVADLSAFATGPCNDMVVDDQGRAWVGNFGFDRHQGETQCTTCLVRVDADGSAHQVADGLLFPNGTVITPDGTLIIAETFAHRLTAFTIEADASLSGRRVFAQFDDVYPDGICLDAEGAVWVADPWGKRILRVFDGGRVAHSIDLAPRGAYACILGGADRRTLYVCTNSGSGPAMAEKQDGRIESLRVETPGAGLP